MDECSGATPITAASDHVPGDPGCLFCRGEGDCLECDPETAWK